MFRTDEHDRLLLPKILLLAFLGAGALHAFQGAKGFILWDEGFLWYGVQRVLAGEAPIRDFLSYDPGRYYLSALPLKPFGINDIVSLQRSSAGGSK